MLGLKLIHVSKRAPGRLSYHWFIKWPLSQPMLTYAQGTNLSDFYIKNIKLLTQENAFENYVCKIPIILSKLQCVKAYPCPFQCTWLLTFILTLVLDVSLGLYTSLVIVVLTLIYHSQMWVFIRCNKEEFFLMCGLLSRRNQVLRRDLSISSPHHIFVQNSARRKPFVYILIKILETLEYIYNNWGVKGYVKGRWNVEKYCLRGV